MTVSRILLPALLFLVGGHAPAIASQPVPSVPNPLLSPLLPQLDYSGWKKKFMAATKLGASGEIKRLIKDDQQIAIYWIMDVAKSISVRSSETLEIEMAALRSGWKNAMDSDFADEIYTFYSLLETVQKKQRLKLVGRYDAANSRFRRNLTDKKIEVYEVLFNELELVAKQFHNLGDYYWSSQSWILAYNCVNKANLGDDANLYKACAAMKGAVAGRLKVDLKDRVYNECTAAYGALKGQGYDGVEGSVGEGDEEGSTGPPASGPVKVEASVVIPMKFEMLTSIGAIARPSYFDDELYGLWQRAALKGKGSSTGIASLGKATPKVLRTASSEVWFDVDGDNKGDVKVPLRGKIDPVVFTIGEGAEKREWGCLVTTGTSTDVYQGIQMNMVPDDNQMMLYLHSGASMVGEVGGVSIQVIDENMDGVYGSAPSVWSYDGLSKDLMQPNMDTVVIDGAKRALPWSEYQKIGDQWYRLEQERNGLSFRAFPKDVTTGKIKLSFKGGKPNWLVVKGAGKYENSYFDLMQKGLELPVGNWTLFCGEMRKGKKAQAMKSLIMPGKSPRIWVVTAGQTTKAELGAPFGFDFSFEEEAKELTVKGSSVVVLGKRGERYERPWNCVSRPEASWRKAEEGKKGKGGKGSKGKKFKPVSSEAEISAANSWAIAWFPQDLTLEKKGGSVKSEVRLTEKKHKLFGKIISGWRE